MYSVDAVGNRVSGATPAALTAYERAIAELQNWGEPTSHAARAVDEAPGFVMAHILQGYLWVCGRDPHRIRAARAIHDRASALPANHREKLHLAAIAEVIGGNYARAVASLDELIDAHPRDGLALNAAQSFDYLMGESQRMLSRVERVMPYWLDGAPGCEAVLASHAFAVEECGDYDRAEECALSVIEMDRANVPAHHVMAHVFEMTDRADAGIRWIGSRLDDAGVSRRFTTHCWWHLALLRLSAGHAEAALAAYDERIWRDSPQIADLIDASALLWRVALNDVDVGVRWKPLADAWDKHISDAYCSFSDLHAMLAFVGARDWDRAARLQAILLTSQKHATRHGDTTRQIGLPACQALIAYGRGDHAAAAAILARLPPLARLFGGSHAQRDVLNATLLQTVQQLRRPASRSLDRGEAFRAQAT